MTLLTSLLGLFLMLAEGDSNFFRYLRHCQKFNDSGLDRYHRAFAASGLYDCRRYRKMADV